MPEHLEPVTVRDSNKEVYAHFPDPCPQDAAWAWGVSDGPGVGSSHDVTLAAVVRALEVSVAFPRAHARDIF
jgi:hypothetical protein